MRHDDVRARPSRKGGRVAEGTGLEMALRRIPQPQDRSTLFAKTLLSHGISELFLFVPVRSEPYQFGRSVDTFWTPLRRDGIAARFPRLSPPGPLVGKAQRSDRGGLESEGHVVDEFST